MGIYIPNVEKPKDCKECQWHMDFYIGNERVGGLCTITEKDDKENTCPLIEIDLVRCEKCKKSLTYTMNSNLPISRWCHRFGVPVAVEDDGYCSDGERRNDE